MDVAKKINDLVPIASRLAQNLCDTSQHKALTDVVSNEQRARLAIEMLKILLQEQGRHERDAAPRTEDAPWP